MRDVKLVEVNRSLTWYRLALPQFPIVVTTPHRVYQSERADSITTVPNGKGEFFLPTPYTAFFGQSTGDPFDYLYQSGTRRAFGLTASRSLPSHVFGHGTTNTVPRVPVPGTNMLNQCTTELLLKLRASDFSAPVALGEALQTINSVIEGLKLIHALWNWLRKGSSPNAYKTMRDIQHRYRKINPRLPSYGRYTGSDASRLWLSWKFGFMPIFRDIYEAIKLLEAAWAKSPPLLKAKRVLTRDIGPPNLGGVYVISVKGHSTMIVEKSVTYSVDDTFRFLASSAGLLDPWSVAWELLPLSFVVDWVIPVGNWLSAITADAGLQFHSGYTTSVCKVALEIQFSQMGSFTSGIPETLRVKHKCMQRSLLLVFPAPKPYISLGLSSNQVVTALTLIDTMKKYR